ncbi:MAG: hypothetical protein Q4P08_02700 [Eubacteriales bacterium]|nr:hypothetical protein [Eubacteriales bacterium]
MDFEERISELRTELAAKNLRPAKKFSLQQELASLYRQSGQALRALPVLRSAYRDSLERNEREVELQLIRELAEIEVETGNRQEAIALLRHELHRRSSRSADYFLRLAENYCLQGEIFTSMKSSETAEIYLQHALTYAKCCENSKSSYKSPEALAEIRRRASAALASLELEKQPSDA